jgi:tripartite-type tricarboxylate transporter receptor subunit TctC
MRGQRTFWWMAIMTWSIMLLSLFPFQAFSEDFPTKPIIIYCGQEAGPTTDLTIRALADIAKTQLGVAVVVENKPGGGATVAATLTASKKPDGYTLGAFSSAALDTRHLMLEKLSYDPFKDFTYIFAYANYIYGICVRKDSPFQTLNDLLEHARKNPGNPLAYSSSGTGSSSQLAVEFLAKQTNVKFKHVPFKGGAPATTTLIGGHVDFTAGAGIHVNYVKQGIFRMLVVTGSEKRDPAFPEIPTLTDLGYKDVPPSSYLLLAPKGLSEPIFKKLEAAFRQAAYSPQFRKVLDNLNIPFAFKNRRELEADFPKHYQFWGDLLKEIGVKN